MMIWLNGALIPSSEGAIDYRDRGFLLGDGLFETILSVRGKSILLSSHWARFMEGAALLEIPVPLDREGLARAFSNLLEANELQQKEAAVRMTLTRGVGDRGLVPPSSPSPTMAISVVEYRSPSDGVNFSACLIEEYRRNAGSILSNVKMIGNGDNIMALSKARGRGYDEAILMNGAGRISCASRANVFVVEGERISTPSLREGALPGIVRGFVIEKARSMGIEILEEGIDPAAFLDASEIFVTNSLMGVVPLARIGDRILPGQKKFGPLFQAAYDQLKR